MEGSCTVFKKYDTPHKNQSQSLLEMMQKYLSGFWPRKCIVYTVYVKKPDMNRCIWSNHNKLSFYAEIQFFGGQWRKLIGKIQWRLIEGICKKKWSSGKGEVEIMKHRWRWKAGREDDEEAGREDDEEAGREDEEMCYYLMEDFCLHHTHTRLILHSRPGWKRSYILNVVYSTV